MSAIKYTVNLNEEEKKKLEVIIDAPKSKARARTRAKILLLTDSYSKWSAKKVSQAVMCSESMVNKTRKSCVEQGVIECLTDKRRNRVYERSLDAKGEAMLVTLACSDAPEGNSVWTMQLLADTLIELEYVKTISDETVRRTLKKMKLNHGRNRVG